MSGGEMRLKRSGSLFFWSIGNCGQRRRCKDGGSRGVVLRDRGRTKQMRGLRRLMRDRGGARGASKLGQLPLYYKTVSL